MKPCPSAKTGFLHSIWAAIASFFRTFGAVLGGFFRFLFGTLLPTCLGLIVAVLLLLAFWELLKFVARKTGLAAWWAEIDRQAEERFRKEKEEKGDLERGKEGDGRELIDVEDGKKRIEAEIQLLEGLLREKRKDLDSLQ